MSAEPEESVVVKKQWVSGHHYIAPGEIERVKASLLEVPPDVFDPVMDARLRGGKWHSRSGQLRDDCRVYLAQFAAARDGDVCWICGGTWGKKLWMRTLEHLYGREDPLSNVPERIVLAHSICNGEVGVRSIEYKITVRDAYRRNHILREKLVDRANKRMAKSAERKAKRNRHG